tara:strand:- start:428432 stop:429718 length:1287 start_codon:yes stop_codon:yes gene_type:complete
MKIMMTVTSLLLSTALLLIGHGMQLTLLPLRAASNGLSDFIIGISASCYFLGFVAGCLFIPAIIARAGHIRTFAALSAAMVSVVLCLDMLDNWIPWLVLRFLTGMAICGLYTVIESWLNSQATAQTRGQILSIYTFIVLTAMAGGQFLINVGPVETATPFSLAALFLALAIIPVGLTRRLAPTPLESTRIRFGLLYQRSHSAFAGALLAGLVAGSFWALGAVFAQRYSDSQLDITYFMTAAIAGGALMQYPIGWISDRVDRRYVMAALCVGGMLSSVAVATSTQQSWHLYTLFLFGGMVMPIYAIALATAADVSTPDEFVEIGTTVLMLNALGAATAPLLLGQLMTLLDATALFWSFSLLCGFFALYVTIQTRDTRAVTVEEQVPFSAAAAEMAPASFDLDPRGTEQEDEEDERSIEQEKQTDLKNPL